MPPSLIQVLAELPDPLGRFHPLVPVLSLALVAILGGCSTLAAISQFGRHRGAAFAHALGIRRGKTPATSTLSELFRVLNADHLDCMIGQWLAGRQAEEWCAIKLDGKTLRGSRDGETPGVHLLAAYASQAAAVVTAYAIFTLRDVCESVRKRCGGVLTG